jgi:hypothetical protein
MVLGRATGKLEDRVQAGRDPGKADLRGVPGERGDEPVAAAPVVEPCATDVPVVGAGADELGQRELLQATPEEVAAAYFKEPRRGRRHHVDPGDLRPAPAPRVTSAPEMT